MILWCGHFGGMCDWLIYDLIIGGDSRIVGLVIFNGMNKCFIQFKILQMDYKLVFQINIFPVTDTSNQDS